MKVRQVRNVLIQQARGTYVAPCGFSAHEGFRFLGPEVRLFEEQDLPTHALTKETLVHGWVRVVHTALKQVGAPVPEPLDYPEELRSFLARPVRRTTLDEGLRRWAEDWDAFRPQFVKPVEHKLFTGHVVERFSDLAETTSFPGDTPVWMADTVNFVTEYRLFVHEHRIRGIKHYRGDPWRTPDKATAVQMVRDYSPAAPVAYGLDVGITEDGRTCLVEINDCYSLGNYGFDPVAYCEMLEDRWIELVNTEAK